MAVLVLHGPHHDLLGAFGQKVDRSVTLEQINAELTKLRADVEAEVKIFPGNARSAT